MSARELNMSQLLKAFKSNPYDFYANFDFSKRNHIEFAYLNIKNHEFKLPSPSDFDRAELLPFLEFVVEELEDVYVDKRTDYPSDSLEQADAIRTLMDSYEDQIRHLQRSKTASSQASWSILAGGVSEARVEAYKLRIAIDQMVNALKDSPAIEEVYRLCGDTFLTVPEVLSKIERHLDKTNYALIQMGSDFYRQRLPHSDRETVDIASKYNPTPSASRYINSELAEPAGSSGVFWREIADLVSDKLLGGGKEVILTRGELTPIQIKTLLGYEEYGLVKNFDSYLSLTEEMVQDLLDIAE